MKSNIKEKKANKVKGQTQFQKSLMKFKRNKRGLVSLLVIIILMFSVILGSFLTPYSWKEQHPEYSFAPPTKINFFDEDGLTWPYVNKIISELDYETYSYKYKYDKEIKYPIKFLVRGETYNFLGLFETNLHLWGVNEGEIFLFGADNLGRDLFSRILVGGRISIGISLFAVLFSTIVGTIIGSITGYFSGKVDMLGQRIIETFIVFPQILIWLSLSAAIPADISPYLVLLGIIIVLAAATWARLARDIRAKTLSVRENDHIQVAKTFGASHTRIIFRHILPLHVSHILVIATLNLPAIVIGESTLSFLGIGIKSPLTSWGALMRQAQNINSIASHMWLLIPGIFILILVLAYNFLGDALRDSIDPYSN